MFSAAEPREIVALPPCEVLIFAYTTYRLSGIAKSAPHCRSNLRVEPAQEGQRNPSCDWS